MKCLWILILIFAINPAYGATTVLVDVPDAVSVGQKFDAKIIINSDQIVSCAQMNLVFDNTQLWFEGATEGDLFLQKYGAKTFFSSREIGTIGTKTTINIGDALMDKTSSSTYGLFAAVTMRATRGGDTEVLLSDVEVCDENAFHVPVTVYNDSITITGSGTPTDTSPTPTATGTLVPTPSLTTSSGNNAGGGGGGGGGGGPSGEALGNIVAKERKDGDIFKGMTTMYAFSKVDPIMSVNITGNVREGDVTTSVEVLRNTSTLVKTPAPGTVYRNVNVWVGTSGFATSRNIKKAIIAFKVENSWLQEHGVMETTIQMLRWNGSEWVALKTEKVFKDEQYTYFEAEAQGFGNLAITSVKKGALIPMGSWPTESEAKSPPAEATPADPPVAAKTPGFEWLSWLVAISAIFRMRR